jgi:hypothetical protein
MTYRPVTQPGMWSTTEHPRMVSDALAKHKGKQIVLTLAIDGTSRVVGKLKDVLYDGLLLMTYNAVTEEVVPTFVMLSAITTIELGVGE